MNDFGWTADPEILAVLKEVIWTEDHQILTNRKDGGVHSVWTYPLGHFDDDPYTFTAKEDSNPIWTRVDLAWGRYFDDGCTFLIWEEYTVRAGTLEDAVLFVKGVNIETPRTQAREEMRQAMERRRANPTPDASINYTYEIRPMTFTAAQPISPIVGNRAQRRAAMKGKRA